MDTKPLCIIGPTATGKSSVAMAVARAVEGIELVSVDSMQVYRGMDIGTAKPSNGERSEVRHHMIDIADPADEFTVSTFQNAWFKVSRDISNRGGTPLLVGGTGLYLRSAIDELEIPGRFPAARAEIEGVGASADRYQRLVDLDPVAASRIDPNNDRRVVRALEVTVGSGRRFSSYGDGLGKYLDVPFTLLGLRCSKAALDERIDRRYDQQMTEGFLDEVESLAIRPAGFGRTARQALGYRELLSHIEDGVPLYEALEQAKVRTHRFARRQLKWFQRDPRIEWLDLDPDGPIDHKAAINRATSLAMSLGD